MDEAEFVTLAQARVAVVGLGLMGGSLALALRGRCREIAGVEPDTTARAAASARGVIDRALDFDSACGCDLLILAAPVRVILAQLTALSQSSAAERRRATVVLDLGSTKAEIAAAMQALPPHFDPLGGHPMCGKEVSGLAHARADLYRDTVFILTPLARTSPGALVLAHELVAAIGARPLALAPERHDALAAWTSHLPYAAAVALMRAALSRGEEDVWTLAASGFRDTTRLAASDMAMMLDILLTNRRAVLHVLGCFRAELDTLAALIDAGDPEALRAALAPAHAQRRRLFP